MLNIIRSAFSLTKKKTNIFHTLGFMEIQEEIKNLLENPSYVNFETLISIHKSFSKETKNEIHDQYINTLEHNFLSQYLSNKKPDQLAQIETQIRKEYNLIKKD